MNSPPPAGDCSAFRGPSTQHAPAISDAGTPSDSLAASYEDEQREREQRSQGPNWIEQRLLTLLSEIGPNDVERRQSIEEALAMVRSERETVEVRVSPETVGAAVSFNSEPTATAERMTCEPQDVAAT